MERIKLFHEIVAEHVRAKELHPNNVDNNLAEWMLILAEEYGEASEEACKAHFMMHEGGLEQEDCDALRERLRKLRSELVQVAAVTLSAIEYVEGWLK